MIYLSYVAHPRVSFANKKSLFKVLCTLSDSVFLIDEFGITGLNLGLVCNTNSVLNTTGDVPITKDRRRERKQLRSTGVERRCICSFHDIW